MKVKKPIIAVGFDEGGIADFNVLGSVGDLTLEQMNSLRTMIPVAIWVMEQLWREMQETVQEPNQEPFSANPEFIKNYGKTGGRR